MLLDYWTGRWFRDLVYREISSIQCHHVTGGTVLTVTDTWNRVFDIKLKDFVALYITEPDELIEVMNRMAAAHRTLHASCLLKSSDDAFYVYMHRSAREFPADTPFQRIYWTDVMDIVKRDRDSDEWRAEGRPNAERDSNTPAFQRAMEEMWRRTLTDAGMWADESGEPARAKRQRKRKAVPVAPSLPCRRIIIKDRGDSDAGTP